MATRKPGGSQVTPKYGLTSKILDTIRSEIAILPGLAGSDYYAKQANPKDGGYAKSNYVKGDGQRFMIAVDPADLSVATASTLALKVQPNLAAARKAFKKKKK
jgi:hypothetical protein